MSEIYEKLSSAILEGNAEGTRKLVNRGLKRGHSPKVLLDNGLIVGMDEVGVRFKRGDMFVPEVLMSADSMAAGMGILRPLLIESGVKFSWVL